MKKLKIILPSKWFCFLLLAITFLVCIHFFLSPHSSKYTGSETTFTGTIMNIEVSGGMLSLEIMGKEKLIGSYFFLTEEEKDSFLVTYSLGDTIYFEGNLVLPSKNSVFNLFNYKEYLERKEIYYLVEIITIQKIDSSKNLLYQLKNKINHHISKYQSSSYLQAFLLGDTSKIDDDILATYQKNGVSHLLAISGMHVSFLSGMLLLLFKKIRFSTLIQYLSVIIFLLFYMILSGNTPSISRAVILFSLISINKVFDLILNTAIKHHVPAENMVKNIIIISDMQFDIFDAQNQISFTNFIKEKYKKAGYEMPCLIYWNVNNRTMPVAHALNDDNNVKIISGFSQSVFDTIIKSQAYDPKMAMLDILNSKIFDKVRI